MVGFHEAGREIDYKVAGVNPEEEMNWKQFLKALLILNAFWFVWGMVLLCTQQWLVFYQQGLRLVRDKIEVIAIQQLPAP